MGGGLTKHSDDDEDSDAGNDKHGSPNSKGGTFSFGTIWEADYVDPPMPFIGKPIGYQEIQNRTRSVKFAMKQMMKVVSKHTNDSANAARTIPVGRQTERVQVTEEIIAMIKERTSKKDDMLFVRDNLTEVQGELAIRRAALKMLNHNYSDVVVRKIDPIQTGEARTLLKHQGVHQVDEETKSPSKSSEKGLPDKIVSKSPTI